MLAAPRPPAPPQTPVGRRAVAGLGRLALRTTPGRIRALAAVVVLAIAGFYVVANIAVGNARDGLRVIGHDAGPQVLATGDLYFALSDMDSQVADILLAGGGSRLAAVQQALSRYNQDRSTADRAALQAAELSAGDPTDQATVRSVLDGLGQYERLATQALDLDKQANRPAGPPTATVIAVYRQATDLMKLQLLPQAYNLTLAGGATVREAYEAKRSAASSGRVWVALTGLAVLVALAGLQIYLVARFRRRVNFALALATAGLIVLGVSSLRLLSGEATQLQFAKADGFDSILTMSRAQAISNSMHADEIRFLLDPGRTDTYSLDYLDKSQTILYVASGNLGAYYAGLGVAMRAYQASSPSVTFLGFYGAEARAHPGPALTAVLTRFQQVQADDQRIRQLARAGHGRQAIAVLTGQTAGSSSYDFDRYDQAIVSLIGLRRQTFDQAIRTGDRDLGRSILGSWAGLLPLAALGLAILVIVGVRPRLAEYR
ncbi:MAG TPA: hypothetical protein VGR98_19900 [Streptosporangiaceae bacterium]|nr:hypothetical protein [Streptosporangiaceae bacterium]